MIFFNFKILSDNHRRFCSFQRVNLNPCDTIEILQFQLYLKIHRSSGPGDLTIENLSPKENLILTILNFFSAILLKIKVSISKWVDWFLKKSQFMVNFGQCFRKRNKDTKLLWGGQQIAYDMICREFNCQIKWSDIKIGLINAPEFSEFSTNSNEWEARVGKTSTFFFFFNFFSIIFPYKSLPLAREQNNYKTCIINQYEFRQISNMPKYTFTKTFLVDITLYASNECTFV